jgi:neutral ceramidase
MVVVDNLGAGPDVLNEAKALAAAKTGMSVDKMLISSTHTHSGPSLNTRSEAAAAYYKQFVEGVAGSIIKLTRRSSLPLSALRRIRCRTRSSTAAGI